MMSPAVKKLLFSLFSGPDVLMTSLDPALTEKNKTKNKTCLVCGSALLSEVATLMWIRQIRKTTEDAKTLMDNQHCDKGLFV